MGPASLAKEQNLAAICAQHIQRWASEPFWTHSGCATFAHWVQESWLPSLQLLKADIMASLQTTSLHESRLLWLLLLWMTIGDAVRTTAERKRKRQIILSSGDFVLVSYGWERERDRVRERNYQGKSIYIFRTKEHGLFPSEGVGGGRKSRKREMCQGAPMEGRIKRALLKARGMGGGLRKGNSICGCRVLFCRWMKAPPKQTKKKWSTHSPLTPTPYSHPDTSPI